MAPRKRTTTTTVMDDAPETDAGAGPDAAASTDAADIQERLQGLQADDATVVLWKMERGEEMYLDAVPLGYFSHETVREEYGPGKYRVRTRAPGNRGWLKGGTFTFSIGPLPKSKQGGGGGGSDMARLERLERLLEDVANRRMQAPAWLGPVLTATLPTLIAKMFDRPGTDPVVAQVLTAMLGQAQRGDALNVAQLLELLDRREERGMRVGEKLGGGGQDEGLLGVVKPLVPMVGQVLAHTMQQPPAAPLALPAGIEPGAPTQETGSTMATASGAASGAAVAPWLRGLAPFAGFLVNMADQNHDVELQAEFIADHIADGEWPAFVAGVEGPNAVEEVIAAVPALETTARRAYIVRLIAALRAQIAALQTDDELETEGGT